MLFFRKKVNINQLLLDVKPYSRDNRTRGKLKKFNKMDEKNKLNIPWWQPGLMLFMRLSAWIVAPVLVAVFFGKYLDRIFQSQPWFFLTFVAIAFTVSIVMIVRIGLREMNKAEEKK